MRCSTFIAGACLLIAVSNAQAQTTAKSQTRKSAKAGIPSPKLLKDGAFRRNGTIMRLQAGRVSRLTAPLTLANGAMVRADGTIAEPDGRSQSLPEGSAVTMQGDIVLLRDDMLTPDAIEELARTVTATAGATVFMMPSLPASAVPPRLLAQLLRTEQKLALLEQMSDKLERRMQVNFAATAATDQELGQVNAKLQQAVPGVPAPGAAPAPAVPVKP